MLRQRSKTLFGRRPFVLHLFDRSSQTPSAVGAIQPKKSIGSITRKTLATVAGSRAPFGQKNEYPVLRRRPDKVSHNTPNARNRYAFTLGRLHKPLGQSSICPNADAIRRFHSWGNRGSVSRENRKPDHTYYKRTKVVRPYRPYTKYYWPNEDHDFCQARCNPAYSR